MCPVAATAGAKAPIFFGRPGCRGRISMAKVSQERGCKLGGHIRPTSDCAPSGTVRMAAWYGKAVSDAPGTALSTHPKRRDNHRSGFWAYAREA